MMENKSSNAGNLLVKLLSSRGFYILLALGLAVIGVSGYVSNMRQEIEQINSYSKVDGPALSREELAEMMQQAAPEEAPEEAEPIQPDEEEQQTEEALAAAADADPPVLMLPLQGEMTAEFSGDALVYNKTMQDWRVHSGIDIRADGGSQVRAAADGVVTSAKEDAMTGFTVILQHEGGLETVYSNLQKNEVVSEGQAVKKGEVIGGVGTTAAFEVADAPHLHFEVRKNEKCVNPFDFMD